MCLAYLDDSESHDKRYQVVGGVILKDQDFCFLEDILAQVIESCVPEHSGKFLAANFSKMVISDR